MLVLIATDDLHGSTLDDRHDAVDGELVTPVVLECPDPHCDVCRRAWFGLVSHGGTTTAMVVDRPGVTEADLRVRVHEWLECSGVVDAVMQIRELDDDAEDEVEDDDPDLRDPVAEIAEIVDDHVREIRLICATYPVGTVVSRLGSLVAPRHVARAA